MKVKDSELDSGSKVFLAEKEVGWDLIGALEVGFGFVCAGKVGEMGCLDYTKAMYKLI